jgi:MFS family permease
MLAPARPLPSVSSRQDADPAPYMESSNATDMPSLTNDFTATVPAKEVSAGTLALQTRANLRASTADGAAFGVMVGAGETYIAAFALAVGLGEVSAGLVSSVPLMAGGILQLVSLRAVQWVGSEKRWVVLCAAMQGLAFVPLFIAALYGSVSLGVLLLIASIYWTGGLASGPAWNTWIESIVPGKIRPSYFAKRSRLAQLTTLIGLVGGGAMLQWAQMGDRALIGFACIFAIAGLFRMWSVYWLASHITPTPSPRLDRLNAIPPSKTKRSQSEAPNTQALPATGSNATGTLSGWQVSGVRLLAYLVMVQGMVQISGPYFASYMLEELQYSYGGYVTLLSIGFMAKVAALTWWVHVAHRGGAKMLLWIGGMGIVPLSALWILSQNFYWLVFVQVISGTLWAAYELGFFLMFFEALPVKQRTRMLTYYNLANTSAWCGGALIGAWLLKSYGVSETGYYVLFAVSSVGRFAALALLIGVSLRSVPALKIAVRVLGVRTASGGVDSPVLPSLDDARMACPAAMPSLEAQANDSQIGQTHVGGAPEASPARLSATAAAVTAAAA